jgi:hypothetical protein
MREPGADLRFFALRSDADADVDAPAPRRRPRTVAATAAGLVTWALLIWLASLFITIIPAAFAFVAVFAAVLFAAGFFLPLSGFGTGSAALWIATLVAGLVALVGMHARFWPLLLGVGVLAIAVTPAIIVAVLVNGETSSPPDQPGAGG